MDYIPDWRDIALRKEQPYDAGQNPPTQPPTWLGALLPFGAHTAGHFDKAQEMETPIKLNGSAFAEEVGDEKTKQNIISMIDQAGFMGQEKVPEWLTGDAQKAALLTNALYKVGYIANIPKTFLGAKYSDINEVEKATDSPYVQALMLSAISDLYHSYNPKADWNLGVGMSDTGTPLLQFRKGFKNIPFIEGDK